jgi:hypothetical protein
LFPVLKPDSGTGWTPQHWRRFWGISVNILLFLL